MLTSDNPRGEAPEAIMTEIAAGIGPHASLVREVDRAHAIRTRVGWGLPSKTTWILIAGKGHEQTQEANGLELPFSDRAIVRQSRNLRT